MSSTIHCVLAGCNSEFFFIKILSLLICFTEEVKGHGYKYLHNSHVLIFNIHFQ